MAYQDVKIPRFYINALEYNLETANTAFNGQWNWGVNLHSQIRTLPVNPLTFEQDDMGWVDGFVMGHIASPFSGYVAILGHNMATVNSQYGIQSETTNQDMSLTSLVNGVAAGDAQIAPGNDGFSIATINNAISGYEKFAFKIYGSNAPNIGSIVIGTYYEMKNLPNLSLTMSRDYGSTKEITTMNGSSVSNTMWNSAPKWGNLGAWEINDPTIDTISIQSLSRSGRRTWQLKFSFMDSGDLWGPNQMVLNKSIDGNYYVPFFGNESELEQTDIQGGSQGYLFNFMDDDNFFSQVWQKTVGGTLPFLFQPNKDDNTQFSIARFKNSTLKATQSAFNVYDISVSIEECW